MPCLLLLSRQQLSPKRPSLLQLSFCRRRNPQGYRYRGNRNKNLLQRVIAREFNILSAF